MNRAPTHDENERPPPAGERQLCAKATGGNGSGTVRRLTAMNGCPAAIADVAFSTACVSDLPEADVRQVFQSGR
jgi:hypothetical protein